MLAGPPSGVEWP